MTPQRMRFLIFLFLIPSLVGSSQDKNVGIRILQEDSVYTYMGKPLSIHLQKKGFKIQVLLEHIRGVYVFASLDDGFYNLPDDTCVPRFGDLNNLKREEEEYNREKELIVGTDCWCFWSVDPVSGSHGFNKKLVELDKGRVVGTKSVKQLYFFPSKTTMKLKDSKTPLYLFFVAVDEEDRDGKPVKELLRRKVKIEWKEED